MSNAQWQKITERFREGISKGEFLPGSRLPSDARLAEEYRVSRPTAHRALAELARLGLVERTKRGTVVAGPLAKATGRVAFIVDHTADRYDFPSAELIRGMQCGLGDDRNLLLCDSGDSAERERRLIQEMAGECDGVFLVPIGAEENADLYRNPPGPTVLLDRIPEGATSHAVLSDNRGATARAIAELQQMGHRNIGFLGFYKPQNPTVAERHAGYRDALEGDRPGLTRFLSPDLEQEGGVRFRQAVEDAIVNLAKGSEGATALFCVQDMIALAAIDVCDALGWTVGVDLDISVFNEWPPALLRQPWRVHRLVPQRFEIGRQAAERLTALIQSGSAEPRVSRVPVQLLTVDRLLSDSKGGISEIHAKK
ncbi:GntR family transcriptional regulator [bacterium]|nr:MAG: GntR family transcriptional regulator [bacterium]